MLLSDLRTGEKGVIVRVNGSGAFRKRIMEMGFIKGKTIKVILNAPLKDPIKYKIMDYEVSLRRSEAGLIEVIYPEINKKQEILKTESSFNKDLAHEESSIEEHSPKNKNNSDNKKVITVALVGNPNAGKTSLFNVASGGITEE